MGDCVPQHRSRPSGPPPPDLAAALDELEQIVDQIENGKLPFEQSLARYQRGNELIRHCQQVLSAARQRIEAMGQPGRQQPDSE